MLKTDSTSTIRIIQHWFSTLGLPFQVVTDNGSQFTSSEFVRFMKLNGIKHMRTPVYHQSSNGQVERYVQTIKKGLKSNSHIQGELQEKLDKFLLAYRSTPSTVTGVSPAKLLFGREISTRLDVIKPRLSVSNVPPWAARNTERYPVRCLKEGDVVKVRNYTDKRKWRSGVVRRVIGSKLYEIEVDGKLWIRHIDQLLKTKCDRIETEDDWQDTIENNESRDQSTSPRYPRRIRKPIERYGIE